MFIRMVLTQKLHLALLFVLVGLALLASLSGCISTESIPGEAAADKAVVSSMSPTSPAALLQAALEKDGFTVQVGRLEFLDIASSPNLPTYFGNNASSPYGFFWLPPAPGQTVSNPMAEDDGMSRFWLMRPDEAVVFLGPTPPAAKYFGFTSYLYDRKGPMNVIRFPIFASLGDTLNNLTIATAKATSRVTDGPFEEQTMIITTADRSIDTRVRAAAAAAAIPSSSINTLAIPSSLLRLGLGPDADSFVQILRVAVFASDTEKKAYISAPPGVVLRLTPKTDEPTMPLDPLPEPLLRESGTGGTEDGFENALNELEAAILAKYSGLKSTPIRTSEMDIKGFDCIKEGRPCLGDNHDAIYLNAFPILSTGRLPDSPEDFFILYGVNHEASGKATYSNASIYFRDRALGVAAINSTEMKGSAELYLPDNPQASMLYAIKVSRRCGTEPFCLEVPVTFPGVPLNEEVSFTFRLYLEPQTRTAPSGSEILFDRVIRFSP